MNKRTKGEKIFSVFNTLFLFILCIIFILPVWHVAMGSISDPLLVAAHSGLFLKPLGEITLGGYELVMENRNILVSYGNTMFYVVVSTFIGLVLNILAAYVMSRRNLMFGKLFSKFVVFTMIFNGGLVPTFIVINKLGLFNSRWAVILPGALTAFNIIIMRTSFMEIPKEMIEAARIDGASKLQQIRYVTLPGMAPTLTIMLIMRIGQILNIGYEKIILLVNDKREAWETADVISTLVYRMSGKSGAEGVTPIPQVGIVADLFNAIIAMCLVLGANAISRRVSSTSLF